MPRDLEPRLSEDSLAYVDAVYLSIRQPITYSPSSNDNKPFSMDRVKNIGRDLLFQFRILPGGH